MIRRVMKMGLLIRTLSIMIIICAANAYGQDQQEKHLMTSVENEQRSIEKTIKNLFRAISFRQGEEPNMHKIKSLFIGEGILINYNDPEPLVLPVDEFIVHFNKQFSDGIMTQLEDREIFAETKVFGRIAHRFSYYEARFDKNDEKPFAVGVNSIQLMKINDEWKITSMAWNDDKGEGFSALPNSH